jgi:hypothetical protein
MFGIIPLAPAERVEGREIGAIRLAALAQVSRKTQAGLVEKLVRIPIGLVDDIGYNLPD